MIFFLQKCNGKLASSLATALQVTEQYGPVDHPVSAINDRSSALPAGKHDSRPCSLFIGGLLITEHLTHYRGALRMHIWICKDCHRKTNTPQTARQL